MINISIIIPTLGNIQNLKRLLDSISRQNFPKERFEILVLANGVDFSQQLSLTSELEHYSHSFNDRISFFYLPDRGVNIARNMGLASAKHEIALFLDDDCELNNPFFLDQHAAHHSHALQVFAIGGGYLLPFSAGFLDEVYNRIQMKWWTSGLIHPDRNLLSRHLLGGNFSIKRTPARAHQLSFDEGIVYGGSEHEFFKRAHSAGLQIVATELDVIHYTQETFLRLSFKVFRQGQGKARIDQRMNSGSLLSNQATPLKNGFLENYLSYVFWLGYYSYQKKYFLIFLHAAKDFIGCVDQVRYTLFNRLSDEINRKKEKGDRF